MRIKICHRQSFKLPGYSAHKRPWDLSWGSCQLPTWESERRTGRHQQDACVLRALQQRGSERKAIRDGVQKCPNNMAYSSPHIQSRDYRFCISQLTIFNHLDILFSQLFPSLDNIRPGCLSFFGVRNSNNGHICHSIECSDVVLQLSRGNLDIHPLWSEVGKTGLPGIP